MPELLFHATVRHDGGVSVVEGSGELDISTAPLLADALEVALQSPPSVLLVDLKRTTFFAGIGAELLLEALSRCKEAGTPVRIAASPAVQRVLDVVGFPSDALRPATGERHRFSLRLHRGAREPHQRGGAGRGTADDRSL